MSKKLPEGFILRNFYIDENTWDLFMNLAYKEKTTAAQKLRELIHDWIVKEMKKYLRDPKNYGRKKMIERTRQCSFTVDNRAWKALETLCTKKKIFASEVLRKLIHSYCIEKLREEIKK